jgi:hypothetical protein
MYILTIPAYPLQKKKKKKYKKKEKKKGTGKAGGNKFPLHDVVWILWRVMLHM